MTIGITGPARRAPWRGVVVALITATIIVLICLILLGLTADFLVDWLWFSAIGYLHVFWTTIAVKAEVFLVVFMATAIIMWVNGSWASRFARPPWTQQPDDFELLTAAAGMAGQELRRAQPNISLAWIAKQMPIKLDTDREHNVEGFRRAGLE
jgi:uncharacterized membrane protein (UPF0182 family)